jgi:hypothetical protein
LSKELNEIAAEGKFAFPSTDGSFNLHLNFQLSMFFPYSSLDAAA